MTIDGSEDGETSTRISPGSADSPPRPAGNELPDVIAGRYEVGPLIGRGATARVHRAVDRVLGRAVAVKFYDRHVLAVDQLRRVRERTLLASVQHPNVVALFDSGTEGDRPYLVMQLVEGENLAERVPDGPFTADEVSELAIRLADALAHVHARGIVHRDLKPANVLLGPGGPVITDFGIAHALDSTHITGTGLVTGTAAYLAPEQILGEQAGPPADVYALGLILLECLTGQREFPGTLAESALARLHRAPRIPDGTPEPLAHALSWMTARDPADRPGAAALLASLREPSGTIEAAVVPLGVPEPVRRRRALVLTGGVVTAAAAAALAVVLAQPPGSGGTPARLPAAAPPTSSVVVPTQVTLSPASAVVLATSHAAKPVTAGGGAVVPPKAGLADDRRRFGGGPVKPHGGPGPDAARGAGPGGLPGRR
ncbi:serine/threonine-protein kinase [Amycolatopsis sp., V23-08]|uniref:non-specific serine/threonine protein kinase n=1 Tax=Amycolatopsis heterodermiae TaxID=3110235 RepID=A0ABU5RCU9_9PSEU|nr:serine/threonine-protein kinase [Amycolatopsis sp., V23-08]MEA5363036.1 serine/threonine-protein kinase [Amycolatopsis sp., V23-08]